MMKKIILSLFLFTVLIACAGNSKEGKNESGTDEHPMIPSIKKGWNWLPEITA